VTGCGRDCASIGTPFETGYASPGISAAPAPNRNSHYDLPRRNDNPSSLSHGTVEPALAEAKAARDEGGHHDSCGLIIVSMTWWEETDPGGNTSGMLPESIMTHRTQLIVVSAATACQEEPERGRGWGADR
jgi:hypothetical protein